MRVLLGSAVFAIILALSWGFSWNRNPKDWNVEMKGTFSKLKFMAAHNATFRKLLENHLKEFDQKPEKRRIDYECSLPKSPSPPTSAHAVRPGDISVVASLGDSITAGYGITAESIIEVILNDRHYSWVTGGIGSLELDVITLTNILRKFNSDIKGFSYDESWEDDYEAGFNVAVGGAIADDMPEQANYLIQKMQDPYYGVDWNNEWKLISLLIGGNDLCRYCFDTESFSPENFAANIQQALDNLYNSVPKAIVVLSNIFDITPLPAFSDNLICDLVQDAVCSCALEVEELKEAQRQYVQKVQELVASGRYDRGREDFTVVYMTHFDNAQPPKIPGTDRVDNSYWAPDCFHPGMKAHFAIAGSLWNQLFEPVGENRRNELDWQIGTNLVCPTEENSIIKTNLNSRKMKTE